MSQMLVNINRVVEGLSNRTTQLDVLYEAILNSIHAKATVVTCRLNGSFPILQDEGEDACIAPMKTDRIEIEDNGEGFDDSNYRSFGRYGSDHKIDMGCKGIGRFTFLKVFKTVHYTSYLAAPGKKKDFDFHRDFESDSIREEPCKVQENKTILSLSDVTAQYYNEANKVDQRLDLNVNDIRQQILRHLIPTLFFSKQQNKSITIVIEDAASKNFVAITEADIPEFATEPITATDEKKNAVNFFLHHSILGGAGNPECFHCANRRTVCTFAKKEFKPQGFYGWLLLESDYFDSHVNNARNDFENILPKMTDLCAPLSWEMINESLKKVLSGLVHRRIPNVRETNRVQLQEIQKERPYLTQYMDDDDLEIAGFINKKQLIDRAKKRFDEAKDNLLLHAGKERYSEQDLEDAMQLAQNELIEYVLYRKLVIRQLKAMRDRKEALESVIHNLFMVKGTQDGENDYFSPNKNNLWLLDDRFTSYSYAASDVLVKTILKQIGVDSDVEERPDFAMFFSQDPANKSGLKAVVIELKPFDDGKKADRKKLSGILQSRDYLRAFKAIENVEEVWAFLVTDVDDALGDLLIEDGYVRLFSLDTPIYQRYYPSLGSIYVIGAKSLIDDAEARNKVFIDIVNKHSRLNKWLEEPREDSNESEDKGQSLSELEVSEELP